MSEMKMEDILANLMLDDRFAGRGKWDKKSPAALQQQVRVRATVLQSELESAVHSGAESVQAAKKALQSFLRAYTTYPAALKHIFHIRTLHLGHAAKSFGLRDAPRGLGSGLGAAPRSRTRKAPSRAPQKLSGKERVANLLRSEYSSGMDTVDPKKKTKIHKKAGKLRLQNQPA